jgi:quercetin dioxygenase-like cupin family protein
VRTCSPIRVQARVIGGWPRLDPAMGAIHRRTGSHSWQGVEAVAYDDPSVAGVEKHELIGPAEGARDYRLRYFHVPAGARTARDRHRHDHGVVIVSGRALVTLGDEVQEVAEGDSVYVAGDELHCFEALGDEPLGFICVSSSSRG